MVSNAVGAKVLRKRSEGTLLPVSPIGCVENKAKSSFTNGMKITICPKDEEDISKWLNSVEKWKVEIIE